MRLSNYWNLHHYWHYFESAPVCAMLGILCCKWDGRVCSLNCALLGNHLQKFTPICAVWDLRSRDYLTRLVKAALNIISYSSQHSVVILNYFFFKLGSTGLFQVVSLNFLGFTLQIPQSLQQRGKPRSRKRWKRRRLRKLKLMVKVRL